VVSLPHCTEGQGSTLEYLWLQSLDIALSVHGSCDEPRYSIASRVVTMEVQVYTANGDAARHRYDVRPDGTYRSRHENQSTSEWLAAMNGSDAFFELKQLEDADG
jgi:hypothetical protein